MKNVGVYKTVEIGLGTCQLHFALNSNFTANHSFYFHFITLVCYNSMFSGFLYHLLLIKEENVCYLTEMLKMQSEGEMDMNLMVRGFV